MVKVYAVVLALGFVALVVILMGNTLASNLNRPQNDPNAMIGSGGRVAVGAALGFGMGGMAAEFSPLDVVWPVALLLAVVGAVVGAVWVRFAERLAAEG